MQHFKADLTNCDIEPIHIPGKIQSHGFLVAVNAAFNINYVSENIVEWLSVSAQSLLNQPITQLEKLLPHDGASDFLTQLLQFGRHNQGLESINPYKINIKGNDYNLIIGKSESNFLLEFEPVATASEVDIQKTIGRAVSEMLGGKQLQELLDNAAAQVKTLIGYDRVMIYKFLEDGHGEVIAEVANPDLDPFLGLHYPATDIPKQARELYKVNLVRIITDVNTEPSPILTFRDENAVPLDLTGSVLRAVSPIHIQYLKNMGVASSFSISLIYRNELWGLIACHNYTPRFINFNAREASRVIGQVVSSALEYKQDEENSVKTREFKAVIESLSFQLRNGSNIKEALAGFDTNLLKVTNAIGAVLVFENEITQLGQTPDKDQLQQLVSWLLKNMKDQVYHTSNLSAVYTPAKAYIDVGSGMLACSLSKELGELLIWFKPEKLTTVKWAGNPDKAVISGDDGLLDLSPRKSFDVWLQTVRNTSERWSREEIGHVLKLREEVMFAINRQANQVRILNEKLQQAYEELDTFSFTVSHDLRTPLSTIKNYSELLLEFNTSLDDEARRLVTKVIGAADKLNMLIKEVLNYSRVGRADISYELINMHNLLHDLKNELTVALQPQNLQLTIGDTPDIHGDTVMVMQIFTNLLNNAIKYSSRSNPSIVKISGVENTHDIVYAISDNGVGIDVNYYSRIFDLFRRMDNVREYDGTGVGLAIVKRIVEKHNGRIWLESEIGVGTIFYVSFKKQM